MQDSKLCPTRMVDGTERHWIDLYSHYQAGHLYRAGGVEDQPAIYMQVMRLIDGAAKESRSEANRKISH